MVRDRSGEDTNGWRAQLQRRALFESRIRSVLERGEVCATVCVPIPSPLALQSASLALERFLAELGRESGNPASHAGGFNEALAAVWTTKLAVVWTADPLPDGGNQWALPEMTRIGDSNYVVRSRAWEVISAPDEKAESYLKRIDDSGREAHAS